jgi:ArsR family transcriptional regulator
VVKVTLQSTQAGRAVPEAGHLDPIGMRVRAEDAAALLKALAHEGRLMTLCHLSTGEKSVSELETLLGLRQAAVSQQLARLRLEGLVDARRDGKTIYYSVRDPKAAQLVRVIYDLFRGTT